MSKSIFYGLCGLIVGLIFLSGCGGGGGSAGVAPVVSASGSPSRGAVQVAIQWSPSGRGTAPVLNSVRLSLAADSGSVVQQVVARPIGGLTASSTTFSNLPPGEVTLTASGYASPDGSGPVLSSGSRAVPVASGQTTQSKLTQTAAITGVQITPTQADVEIGRETRIKAFAQDSNGNMVLSPGLTWQWTSSNPAVATVTAKGETAQVLGVAPGESTLSAQIMGTDLRYLITVTVRPRASYTITDLGAFSGGTEFIPLSINNSGVVVGKYTGALGLPGGFLWQNGKMQNTIPVTGNFKDTASYGFLYAVNSRNQLAGWQVPGGHDSETVQVLLPADFGSGEGIATSLNSSQAVGVVESSSVYSPTLAVLWTSGKARQTLPALHDSLYSRANHINNHNQIAGESESGVTLESVPGGSPRRRRDPLESTCRHASLSIL